MAPRPSLRSCRRCVALCSDASPTRCTSGFSRTRSKSSLASICVAILTHGCADFTFPSGDIVEGTELTATTSPHAYVDSLAYERWWYRVGDTTAVPQGAGGTWLYDCEKDEECSYAPTEAGRFYLRTRVYVGGTYYQETVSGDVVWPKDYVFEEEPDTIVELGDITMEVPCASSSVWVAKSCTGGGGGGTAPKTFENVHLAFVCHPALRGTESGCKVMASAVPDSVPLDSLSWRFIPADLASVPDTIEAIGDTIWWGTMVTTGTVELSLRVDTFAVEFSGPISVLDRNWNWGPSDWLNDSLSASGFLTGYLNTGLNGVLHPRDTWTYANAHTQNVGVRMAALCRMVHPQPHISQLPCTKPLTALRPSYNAGETGGYQLATVVDGPNDNLAYVSNTSFYVHSEIAINSRLNISDTLHIYYNMSSCSNMNWWNANLCEAAAVNDTLMSLRLDSLREGTLFHEGLGRAGNNGHLSHLRMAAAAINPADSVEAMVALDTTSLGTKMRLMINATATNLDVELDSLSAQLHPPQWNTIWSPNFAPGMNFYLDNNGAWAVWTHSNGG